MPPVRVAHVIHDLRLGGTERRLLAVLAGLDRGRFDPLLVCIDGLGPLADEARSLGIEPFVLGRSHRLDMRGLPRLARMLRREGVKVAHGWLSLANVFVRVAGPAGDVMVRVASEGGAVTTTSAARSRRDALIDRALDPLTHAYVANSEAVAASLLRKDLPREKVVVIPNGVAVLEPLGAGERTRLRAELGASGDDTLAGMAARLDPGFKDHETFLLSVAALAREGRPVRAAILGDGPGRGSLERLAVELGIADRVLFTGFRRDAAHLFGALDVSVLLTYAEGFSNVVLESMAAGVPLLTTDIPPNREAVENGIHGLLVPIRDVGATTAALGRLLDDGALAAGLGAAARARALEHFSLEAQAESTMALYERLLEKRVARL